MEWSPRPRTSCFRGPREGNWGVSRDPRLQARKPRMVRSKYRPGSDRSLLVLGCDGVPCIAGFQPLPARSLCAVCGRGLGARGTWLCGGFVGLGQSQPGRRAGFRTALAAVGGGSGSEVSAGVQGKGHVGWGLRGRLGGGVRVIAGACRVALMNAARSLGGIGPVPWAG